jgi:hypothetical protein
MKTFSNRLRFGKDALLDSSQSILRQHWREANQVGFARVRFLILLCLFAPLLIFHEKIILQVTDGITFIKQFDLARMRADAWFEEYETNLADLKSRLNASQDPVSIQAVQLLESNTNWLPGQYPSSEEIRQMNIRIAREVIAKPLTYSWFSKAYNYSDSDASQMYEFLWRLDGIVEFKRCNDIGKNSGHDASCTATWNKMLEMRKFEELMQFNTYTQPTQNEMLVSLENNQYAQLQREYIIKNSLDTCTFSDSRRFYNNINCPKLD